MALKKKIKEDNLSSLKKVESNEEDVKKIILPKKKVYKSLDEVIDKNRKLKMFYSGVENESYLDILYDLGIRDFLMSYHYLKGKGSHQIKKHPDMHLFIDSGAFTYMNDPIYEEYTVEQWEKQIIEYLEWVKKRKEHIFAIADLDLQYLVGEEKVYEWRKKYFEPFMLNEGVPVCFMYHEEGLDRWEYMCKRYPYVGISLNVDGNSIDFQNLTELFRIAEKYDTVIQGMASTRTSMLQEYPFYTVDSSVSRQSIVTIKEDNKIKRMTIGNLFNKYFLRAEKTDKENEKVIDLTSKEIYTPTILDNSKLSYEKLDGVVQHIVNKDMYYFKLENSKFLECTEDHSLIVLDEEYNLIEKCPYEMLVGEYLFMPNKYEFPINDLEVVNFKKDYVNLDDSLIHALAILNYCAQAIGENTYKISCNDIRSLKNIIKDLNIYFSDLQINHLNDFQFTITSNKLNSFLYTLNYDYNYGNDFIEIVPLNFLINLSERQIREYLRAYLSCARNDYLYLKPTQKDSLQFLLNGIGIYPLVESELSNNRVFYKMYFISNIDLFHIKHLNLFKNNLNKLTSINYYTQQSNAHIYEDLRFLKILDIDCYNNGSIDVYDLTVNKTQRFLANDILVHNTSWLVGLKYGEMNVWDGKKMRRAKKTEFETKAFPMMDKYDKKFDYDKIRNEDTTEMIRANAYAFVLAERHIHERLKSKMYWLKAKASKKDLEDIQFNNADWLEDLDSIEEQEIKDYAKILNINPDLSLDELKELVTLSTVFCNYKDEDYKEFIDYYYENEDVVEELHDQYINRIVDTIEEKLNDLHKFFKECVEGKNDYLLQIGTNFDRVVKEREYYIDDEEVEHIEVEKEEVLDSINKYLPSPIDTQEDITRADLESRKLDEEIFKKEEIIPQFDERGRLLKGNKITKRKRVYSQKYPKFACDTCHVGTRCPEYKSGFVCAYHKLFNRFDTRNVLDIISAMQGMVDHNLMRTQKAMIEEIVSGTHNSEVSSLIDQNMRLLSQLKSMYDNASPTIIKQARVYRPDGSYEEKNQITNPSGGILEKLFGNFDTSYTEQSKEEKKEEVIEVKLAYEEEEQREKDKINQVIAKESSITNKNNEEIKKDLVSDEEVIRRYNEMKERGLI